MTSIEPIPGSVCVHTLNGKQAVFVSDHVIERIFTPTMCVIPFPVTRPNGRMNVHIQETKSHIENPSDTFLICENDGFPIDSLEGAHRPFYKVSVDSPLKCDAAHAFMDACERREFAEGCTVCDALKKLLDQAHTFYDKYEAQPRDEEEWSRYEKEKAVCEGLIKSINCISAHHTCLE